MTRVVFRCLTLCSAFALSATSFAGDKQATYDQMLDIAQQIQELRANNAAATQIESLTARYDAMRRGLGGDDPANMYGHPTSALEPTASGTPQYIAPPPCGGLVPHPASFPAPGGPIPDLSTVSFTVLVAVPDEYLWDVDLTTFITHTFAADLDITLTSPAGTVVKVTTDNGGGADNVFNGTIWDDNFNDPVTDHLYTNLVLASPLSPEGRFSGFRGEDPNGTWTLTITDDAGADVGALSGWSLDIVTFSASPNMSASTFMRAPALPIVDLTTVADAMPVAGLDDYLVKVVLYMEITHTFNADLDIQLVSPAGTQVTVTTDNGGSFDNVFNGSTFDPEVQGPVTDHVYANLVVATPLSPEGSFDVFTSENPNGVWQLVIFDDAGADVGVLHRWDLTLVTCGAPLPSAYCTAGTSSNGCIPGISANANPSVSFANPCIIRVAEMEGQKSGIIFYGISGPVANFWNGISLLCVKGPLKRTGVQNSGGTTNMCDGLMTLDWNAYQAAHPGALGQPWAVGNMAWVQGWYRDPPAPKTTNLSDALKMTYSP